MTHPSPLDTLLAVMDEQVALLADLLDASQREQRHILAFEPKLVGAVVEEKKALIERERDLEERRQEAVGAVLESLGVDEADVPNVWALVPLVPQSRRSAFEDRCNELRALVDSLRELQAVSLVHAERGLDWIQGYLGKLRNASRPTPSKVYGATGRTTSQKASDKLSTVHRCA